MTGECAFPSSAPRGMYTPPTTVPVHDGATLLATCRVCGSRLRPWRRPWLGFTWGRCQRCHSVQKLITERQYADLNPTYDPGYRSGVAEADDAQQRMDVDGKEKLLRRTFPDRHSGRLLDIGCGMGGFLLAGRRLGMQVVGVEPSAAHSKAAVTLFGLDVRTGYFDRNRFSGNFDLIILSHVIEHIYLPQAFLDDVTSLLAPGGALLVATPNVESLAAACCGRYWSMFKPIDHVTMLGRTAIPFLVPARARIDAMWTDEWPGEFAANVASAVRTAAHPKLSNTAGTPGSGNVRTSQTLPTYMKAALALASAPFHALGTLAGRNSCLYFTLRRQ